MEKIVIRYSLFVLILSFVICHLSFSAYGAISGATADPGEIGVGARPLGMGKAYVGVADDGSAIFMNPSGLGRMRSLKLGSMSGVLLQDINYTVIGAANPFDFGTVGIGFINAGISGIPITTLTGAGTPEFTGESADYNASLIYLSYGTDLSKYFDLPILVDTTVGGSLKIFLQGFKGGGASLEGATGSGLDMDLGLQYRPRRWATLGMNLQNCLPASLGGKFVWQKNNIEEGIPMVIKGGVAAKIWGRDALTKVGEQELILALDSDMSATRKIPGVWHAGVEWWPAKVLALRVGIDQKPKATTTGTGVENNMTAGVGLRYAGYTFDYAYHYYGELQENITHYFSLGYVGEEEVEEEIKPTVFPITPPPLPKPKPSLKTFSDVGPGYWAKEPIEYLATLNIIGGYPDNTFRPDWALTRAELATLLIKAKEIAAPELKEDVFPDLPRTHWAAKYVKAAMGLKYVSGYPDNTFRPVKALTRAEGIIIFSRFAELPIPESVAVDPFSDLPKTHWAAKYVEAAKNAGLLLYLANKPFGPNADLTRAEAAEILSKTPFGKAKIKELLGE